MELAQHLHVYRESATALRLDKSEFQFSIAAVWNGQPANNPP